MATHQPAPGASVQGIGERGILKPDRGKSVLLETGFEADDPKLAHPDHQLWRGDAHAGSYALHGRLKRTNAAAFLNIPFQGMGGRRVELTFWIRSSNKAKCAVWVTTDNRGRSGRKNVGTYTDLKPAWTMIRASALPRTDQPGYFEIVGPSSYGAGPGDAWIDTIQLTASEPTDFTLTRNETFPALTTDALGQVWLAVVARSGQAKQIRIYRIANQRDIEGLDFTAITDHGYNLDHPQWAYTAEQVRAFFDPGQFVTLLGEEWTADHVHYVPRRTYRRYGHRRRIANLRTGPCSGITCGLSARTENWPGPRQSGSLKPGMR